MASARQQASNQAKHTPKQALSKLLPTPPGIKGYDPNPNPASRHRWEPPDPDPDLVAAPPQIPFQGFSAPPERLVPDGWLEQLPDLGGPHRWQETSPQQCEPLRGPMVGWIAEGMRLVHEADTADTSEPTVAFGWGSEPKQTHAHAVESAVAVLVIAEAEASEHGFSLLLAPREETPGLIKDLPVAGAPKDLSLMCLHYGCVDDEGGGDLCEIGADWDWPSAAAAAESWMYIL